TSLAASSARDTLSERRCPRHRGMGHPSPNFFVSVDYSRFKFFVFGSADFKAVIVRLLRKCRSCRTCVCEPAKRKTIAIAFEVKPSGSLGSGVGMFFADN